MVFGVKQLAAPVDVELSARCATIDGFSGETRLLGLWKPSHLGGSWRSEGGKDIDRLRKVMAPAQIEPTRARALRTSLRTSLGYRSLWWIFEHLPCPEDAAGRGGLG